MDWITSLPLDELIKSEPGGKLVQTILLLLIYLNIRALKQALLELEAGHDKRITVLENRQQSNEARFQKLENKVGG